MAFLNVFFSFLFSKEMRQQFDIRRLSLEEQRNHLQQQLETIREELTTKLNMANQEVYINSGLHFLFSSKHISWKLDLDFFFFWSKLVYMVDQLYFQQKYNTI